MTSIPTSASTFAAAAARSSGPLLGFGNLLRKEVTEWLRGRRAYVVLVVSALIMVLTASNAAIIEWLATVVPEEAAPEAAGTMSLDPLTNVAGAVTNQLYILAATFATISLLIVERDKGTLAWTLSKPVTRPSVLAAKWVSATGLLWLLAVVVPLLLTALSATFLYGQAPDPLVVTGLGVVLVLPIALATALTLAAGTVVRSQAAVAAIAIAIWFLFPTFAAILPGATAFLPTEIDRWGIGLVIGQPVSLVTPASWAVAVVALLWIARRRLGAMEF